MNAQRLRLEALFSRESRIQYCEGYIAWDNSPLALDHAWITIDGKVVDVTLRAMSKKKLHSYFGMVVPVRLMLRNQRLTERYSPVIEGPLQAKLLGRKQKRAAATMQKQKTKAGCL